MASDNLPPSGVQYVQLPIFTSQNYTYLGILLAAPTTTSGAGSVGTGLCVYGKQIVGAQLNGLAGGTIEVVGSSDPVNFDPSGSHVEPTHWDALFNDNSGTPEISGSNPGWLTAMCQIANWLAVRWKTGAPSAGILRVALIDPFKL